MTDKELLELAAKAAGLVESGWVKMREEGTWNPLADDGDALQLAVKLGLDILITPDGETTVMGPFLQDDGQDYGIHEVVQHGDDPYAATRRAIVMAAAEIGKGDEMTTIRHSSIQQDAETEALKQRIAELEVELRAYRHDERNARVTELEQRCRELNDLSDAIRDSAATQAREAKLREALDKAAQDIASWGEYAGEYFQEKWGLVKDVEACHEALALPQDDTALKEAIRQAKREALLEAADACETTEPHLPDAGKSYAYMLRRMAEEL